MKKILIATIFFSGIILASVKFIPLYIGAEKFVVEVADTTEKRIKGLMFRKSIPENYGMLFIFDNEEIHGMWMKNTLIHLDIIFLNKDKQIMEIYYNVPPCKKEPCESYVSKSPVKYVLELRGKRSEELGLKIGDSIIFIVK